MLYLLLLLNGIEPPDAICPPDPAVPPAAIEAKPDFATSASLSYSAFKLRIEAGEKGTLYIGIEPPAKTKGLVCYVKTLGNKAKGVYRCFAVKGVAFLEAVKAKVSNYIPRWRDNGGRSTREQTIKHAREVHGFTGTDDEVLRQHDAWHDANGGNLPARQFAPQFNPFPRLQSPT